jgi:glutamine amidotransferase
MDMGSFGVGYYSRGELLQTVEPHAEGEIFDIAKVLRGVRADLILMHARSLRKETVRREDIHPFRFKDWLFAHNGRIAGFDEIREKLTGAIPEFIKRNIRGETDSEYLFHLFLSFLYDAGQLGRPNTDVDHISDALTRTFSTVDEFLSVAGHAPSPASVIVSDGYSAVAGGRGIPVEYARINGVKNCAVCRTSVRPGEREATAVDHPDVNAVLICSCTADGSPHPFERLQDNALLLVTRTQEISIRGLR